METNKIIQGDALTVLKALPNSFVQCVVTSPPYWGLRSYLPDMVTPDEGTPQWVFDELEKSCVKHVTTLSIQGGIRHVITYRKSDIPEHLQQYFKPAELGLEPTPEEFVEKTVEIFREVRRILRPDGVCFLNLGDSYSAGGNGGHFHGHTRRGGDFTGCRKKPPPGLKPKDLVGIPWRVAFALQADGWYLRQDIIWHKPNPMPESVTDRCTKAHEYIFLLSKSARYYYDAEAVKEGASMDSGFARQRMSGNHHQRKMASGQQQDASSGSAIDTWTDTGTRNRRSVWTIATQSFHGAHFACVDSETECLSVRGWLPHDKVRNGDMIAAFDGARLSWKPAMFYHYDASASLVAFESRDLSLRLTTNHRQICRDYRNGGDWQVKRADDLLSRDKIPTSGPWPTNTGNIAIPWAELAGWVLTDGSYNQGRTITIYQTGGRGKCSQIEATLNNNDVSWQLYSRNRGHGDERAYSFGGRAAQLIRRAFPKKEGNFDVLYQWNDDSLQALWQGMTEGDGNRREDGRVTFVGTRQKVDFYQALSLRLGMTCRVSPRKGKAFNAFVSKKTSTSMRGTGGVGAGPEREDYKGIVWCPSVEGGMWLARRNGRPFITGNTFPEKLPLTCIRAGTSEKGCCPECGKPWERVIEQRGEFQRRWTKNNAEGSPYEKQGSMQKVYKTLGWQPGCSCNAGDPIPCVVMDPFSGAGTTLHVAKKLNRRWLGIELNPEYIKLAEERMAQEILF